MSEPQQPEHIWTPGNGCANNIFDNLIEGCQVIAPDWRYLYVNDAAAGQNRLPKEQLIGQLMMQVYPGIENTPMFSMLRQCMQDRIPRQMENEFTFADGSKDWFELRFEPVPQGVFILSLKITERKRSEAEQQVMCEMLQLINSANDWASLLKSMLGRLKQWSGCEAVGIRIKDGPDYPYYTTSGFSEEFVRMENYLCAYDENGELLGDEQGNPLVECMCGNVICGRFDPTKTFFTSDGSFWTNCTSELLASTTDAERQDRTRNRCNGEGYESVALIPLRCGQETFGLIQFNDKRRGCFTPELVARYRRIADNIANFLARKHGKERIKHLNAVLRSIRNVNQLITREKDRRRLLQRSCDLLLETPGFYAVLIGLLDHSHEKILAHTIAGTKLESLSKMLDHGKLPDCVHQAITSGKIVVRKNRQQTCKCPGTLCSSKSEDAMVISLKQEEQSYGFMVVCISTSSSNAAEEQDLLQEVANDIAFALRSMEIEIELDQSAAALTKTEQQLRQIQKLESLGQLAGGVAHDFNNILMAQIGYCELMQLNLNDEDPYGEEVEQIKKCAERAAALTRQLLAFSRKQTLQPEVLDLNAVVTNIEKMLRRLIGEDIDFVTILASDLGKIKADPGQLEQVIVNLAVNARDAMSQGGKLTIETVNVELDEEYVRHHVDVSAGDYVMLTISDTGCGMDTATKKRLFEPFFTTKERGRGTGLGLAMVYGIVKQSEGHIWVYSEPGQGTTFKVYLPRVQAKPISRSLRKTRPSRGQGQLILVVEDDPILRKLFARMISDIGYQAKVAANGDEALITVDKDGLRPELLITDVVMPGMSGRELGQRLVQIQPQLKVLYISGYTDNSIVNHGVLDPQIPFLQKPFSILELAAKIREVLSSEVV